MYGYDKIPTTLYAGEMVQGEFTPSQQAERAPLHWSAARRGFDESMSHSFISPKFYDMIGWDENDPRRISTTILNPLGEDFSVMRTTVLPSMLDNLAHNHAHRNPTASCTSWAPFIPRRSRTARLTRTYCRTRRRF